MEFFNSVKYDTQYCSNIKESKYTQGLNKHKEITINEPDVKKYKFLFDCIIYSNDPDSIFSKYGAGYVDKKKMEMAVDLDEKSNENYDKYNYHNFFKKKIIQKNLININFLSSIFYVCDYFKISLIIFDSQKNKLISVCSKYNDIQIYKFNNGWNLYKEPINKDNIIDVNKNNISLYFNDDLNGNYYIYNNGLEPISKYKLIDLQNLALKYKLNIKFGSKNKLKTELYHELYKLDSIN